MRPLLCPRVLFGVRALVSEAVLKCDPTDDVVPLAFCDTKAKCQTELAPPKKRPLF